MDETGQNMDIDHRQVCLNLEKATQIITQALQHEAGKNQELCLLVFRLEEREAEIGRSLTEQMESNRQLKLKIDELKKDLEEKDNSFTQANQTVTLLKNKLRDLHQQLQIQQSNHRAFQELNKWLPCEQSQLKIENTMDTSGPENLMDVSDSQCPLVSSDAQRSLEGPVSRIKEEVDGGYGEYSQSERTDHRTESIISSAAEFRLELIREEEKPITVPALISEMDLSLTDPESLARLSGVSLMPKDCSKTQRGCNVEMNDGEQPENIPSSASPPPLAQSSSPISINLQTLISPSPPPVVLPSQLGITLPPSCPVAAEPHPSVSPHPVVAPPASDLQLRSHLSLSTEKQAREKTQDPVGAPPTVRVWPVHRQLSPKPAAASSSSQLAPPPAVFTLVSPLASFSGPVVFTLPQCSTAGTVLISSAPATPGQPSPASTTPVSKVWNYKQKRRVVANSCRKCGQFRTAVTGHSQFKGTVYCPNTELLSKEEWLKQKKKEYF
ncbi:protein PRRC2C-like isoform X2 [Sardina pilchardus]|uniref:protein PRRC2C-like isoform X2 n=1 Tax=Sardina pilchardus TaxID=27697 RepID=UPI002E119582